MAAPTSGSGAGTGADPSCSAWDHGDCEGTAHCPPRCPRFYDCEGVPLLAGRASPDDREALVELYDSLPSSTRTMGLPPEGRSRIRTWLADLLDRGWHLVARDGKRLVGHAAVVPAGVRDPELLVFVHDDYHGRGVGTELLRQVLAYAADDDHEALTLDVAKENRPAVGLFRGHDFEVVERTPAELRMRLPLSVPLADAVRRPPARRDDAGRS